MPRWHRINRIWTELRFKPDSYRHIPISLNHIRKAYFGTYGIFIIPISLHFKNQKDSKMIPKWTFFFTDSSPVDAHVYEEVTTAINKHIQYIHFYKPRIPLLQKCVHDIHHILQFTKKIIEGLRNGFQRY